MLPTAVKTIVIGPPADPSETKAPFVSTILMTPDKLETHDTETPFAPDVIDVGLTFELVALSKIVRFSFAPEKTSPTEKVYVKPLTTFKLANAPALAIPVTIVFGLSIQKLYTAVDSGKQGPEEDSAKVVIVIDALVNEHDAVLVTERTIRR